MPKRMPRWLVVTAMAFALSSAAWAHHSQSEFDFNSVVEVEGNVTNLDWRSPHARLYVDVVDGQGKVANWNFEMPSPMTLMRRGWKRNSLKPGDHVTVKGARARHFPDIAYLIVIRDATGKPLFTGVTQIYEPEPVPKSP
jgi:exonuclease VII large subunit